MSVNSRTSYHFCNCPYCAHQKSIPELTIYEICKEYIDINSLSGTKIDGWEIDVYIPSKNICVEYDGSHFHNSDEAKERENRKNSCILEDSKNYTMIRIKETTDSKKLELFKEITDSGVIIYYISNGYRNKYFIRLSKIIKDIFNIEISDKELFNKFNSIKTNIA